MTAVTEPGPRIATLDIIRGVAVMGIFSVNVIAFAMIEQAYARLAPDDPPPTDDAELCERAGFPVKVVPDSVHNLKLTTADDFRIAEALARELR